MYPFLSVSICKKIKIRRALIFVNFGKHALLRSSGGLFSFFSYMLHEGIKKLHTGTFTCHEFLKGTPETFFYPNYMLSFSLLFRVKVALYSFFPHHSCLACIKFSPQPFGQFLCTE